MRSHSIDMSLNLVLLVALTVAFLGQTEAGCIGRGKLWCTGECHWNGWECENRVICAGREKSWCNGDCYWNGWECENQVLSCPLGCPKNYEPVCGEDGKTYGNECEACGVKVACQGKCPCQKPSSCGGREKSWCNGDCYWNGWECEDRVPSCRDGCPKIYEPVCGEDGKTYGNDCEACGVKVACQGKCPCQLPSCASREKSWCNGDCYWNGWECENRVPSCPFGCPKNYEPVCGEDGKTYVNECYACGVKVACQGKCPCQVPSCAGREKSWCNGDCYWNGWECENRVPSYGQYCPQNYEPVCGEDGKTYGNECEACGVKVACQGKCPCQKPSSCGGREKAWCNGDCYWNGWECENRVPSCPLGCPRIYEPVCGEDGKTYGNECEACGVDVSCQGECPCKVPSSCSGREKKWCKDGCYWNGSQCKSTQVSSCAGREKSWCNGECYWNGWECEDRVPSCSSACPKNYDPVCGEDGKTYGNECEACGVKVACQGKCPCPVSCDRREKSWCNDGDCYWNGWECKSYKLP